MRDAFVGACEGELSKCKLSEVLLVGACEDELSQ